MQEEPPPIHDKLTALVRGVAITTNIANAKACRNPVGNFGILPELQRERIQILFAFVERPPKPGLLNCKRREFLRCQRHRGSSAGTDCDVFLNPYSCLLGLDD